MSLLAIGMLEGYSRWTHPDGGRDYTLSGAMFVLGACALSMALGASAGWFYLRGIYRLLGLFEKGEYLAHWTCSRDEWHSFLNGEPQRRTAQGLNNTLVLTVLGALAGAIFFMLVLADPPPRQGSTFAMLAVALAIPIGFAIFGLVITALTRWLAKRRAKRLRDRPGDVYIGTGVAYCAEECWDWFAWKTVAFQFELVPGSPALLRFTITTSNPSGGDAVSVHHVPVPAGKLPDAERVILSLQGKSEGC